MFLIFKKQGGDVVRERKMSRSEASDSSKDGSIQVSLNQLNTGSPRYSRIFLSANLLIPIAKNGQIDNFPFKKGLFICEFKIRGPK
jgi:hypothetical protein